MKIDSDDPNHTDVIPEWIKLQLGAFNMLAPHGRMIFSRPNNPFNRLASIHEATSVDYTLNPDDGHLVSLLPLFSSALTSPSSASSSASSYDPSADEICLAAFSDLRSTFAFPYTPGVLVQFRDVMALWPIRQPQKFFGLLKEDHPKALIVFAYYCVLLKRAEEYWYLRGQGRKVLADIRRRLEYSWECWIAWPLHELGFESGRLSKSNSESSASPSEMTAEGTY